jgi:hypothetical protein
MTGLMDEANALNTASLQGWVTTSPGMPSLRPRREDFNDLEREESDMRLSRVLVSDCRS